MNSIDILIEGYARITKTGWEASSTTCFITTPEEIKIITDPGCNRELLLQKLDEKSIQKETIEYVFLTHHHLDHAMNIALFPKAKVVDTEAIYHQDIAIEGAVMIPQTDITILKTPGHEYAHGALVVPTSEGSIIIAGDNFWWEEREKQIIDINKKDDFADNMDVLIKSRKELLSIADWIIPGHGKKQKIDKHMYH